MVDCEELCSGAAGDGDANVSVMGNRRRMSIMVMVPETYGGQVLSVEGILT